MYSGCNMQKDSLRSMDSDGLPISPHHVYYTPFLLLTTTFSPAHTNTDFFLLTTSNPCIFYLYAGNIFLAGCKIRLNLAVGIQCYHFAKIYHLKIASFSAPGNLHSHPRDFLYTRLPVRQFATLMNQLSLPLPNHAARSVTRVRTIQQKLHWKININLMNNLKFSPPFSSSGNEVPYIQNFYSTSRLI